jgi:LemA protein
MVILLALAAAVILILASIYNSLVWKRNSARNAFASVDIMLKRRCDLIPNLVETVKGYARHEQETFVRVTELRTQALAAGISDGAKIGLDREVTSALGRLLVVAEAYPQLQADANFLHLQRTLAETEEQIAAARRAYNAAVVELNNACEMFPTNLFASAFGIERREFFQATDTDRAPVTAKF